MVFLFTICVYEDVMIVVFDSMGVPVNFDEKVSQMAAKTELI